MPEISVLELEHRRKRSTIARIKREDRKRVCAHEVKAVLFDHQKSHGVRSKLGRAMVKAAHVKQASRVERAAQNRFRKFFERSVAEVVKELDTGWTPDPENAAAQARKLMRRAFDLKTHNKALAKTAVPAVAVAFVEGAEAEVELAKAASRILGRALKAKAVPHKRPPVTTVEKASTATEALARLAGEALDEFLFATELPDWLREAAQDYILATFQQSYWQRINLTTRDDIEGILYRAIEDGLSIRDIAKQIMAASPAYSRARAINVARTEMTGSMNAGHKEAIRWATEGLGLEPAKEWMSVMGTTTRETHADADGQQQPLDAAFEVGGYPCQFPGDASLPPDERCNCQCTILSAFVGEAMEDDEDEPAENPDVETEDRAFDPDQPRDEAGKWTSGGGSGAWNADNELANYEAPNTTVKEDATDFMKKHKLSAEKLRQMAGAPKGAKVSISKNLAHLGPEVIVTGKDEAAGEYRMVRNVFMRDKDMVVQNHSFEVEKTGTGFGLKSFGQQVDHASAAGLKHIETYGIRRDKGGMIGYKVWPRMGYDGDFYKREVKAPPPESLNGSTRLSDVMSTPEGRSWWDAHGHSVDLTFDLKPGSLSMRILGAYREKKK